MRFLRKIAVLLQDVIALLQEIRTLLRSVVENLEDHVHPEGYLSKKQAASYLSVSPRTLDNLVCELPCFRIGRKVLFRKCELDQWVDQHRIQSNSEALRRLADEAVKTVLGTTDQKEN